MLTARIVVKKVFIISSKSFKIVTENSVKYLQFSTILPYFLYIPSVSLNFLRSYMKFRPNFFTNFLIFLQNSFLIISKRFNFSKCSPVFLMLVYTLVETARDEMRTRVWRVHLSLVTRSQPVIVSFHSSWKNVGKSYPSQRTQMSGLIIEATFNSTSLQRVWMSTFVRISSHSHLTESLD